MHPPKTFRHFIAGVANDVHCARCPPEEQRKLFRNQITVLQSLPDRELERSSKTHRRSIKSVFGTTFCGREFPTNGTDFYENPAPSEDGFFRRSDGSDGGDGCDPRLRATECAAHKGLDRCGTHGCRSTCNWSKSGRFNKQKTLRGSHGNRRTLCDSRRCSRAA